MAYGAYISVLKARIQGDAQKNILALFQDLQPRSGLLFKIILGGKKKKNDCRLTSTVQSKPNELQYMQNFFEAKVY